MKGNEKLPEQKGLQERRPFKWKGLCVFKWLQNKGNNSGNADLSFGAQDEEPSPPPPVPPPHRLVLELHYELV